MKSLNVQNGILAQVTKGHIVDVVAREVFDGEIIMNDGKIEEIRRCRLDGSRKYPYLLPGFIDSHTHIESTMMIPSEYARIAVCHGTIGVVADSHEIGNVLGSEGVDFMIRNGREAQFNFCFGAPSCVPSVGGSIETSGAAIDADEIERLMKRGDIGFLSEMMNCPGVIGGDKEVIRKIEAARAAGKPVDGHATGLTSEEFKRYAEAGITTNHECSTLHDGRMCIGCGMKVIIREGSAAKDYEQLRPLIDECPDMVMFCTDDCNPDDLVRSHINGIVRRALADGYDLWNVLQAACLNPQKHYHLEWGLLQPGDPATFIAVDNLTPHFRVESTVVNGCEVFNYNKLPTASNVRTEIVNHFEASPISEADIAYDIQASDTLHIIHATDGSLITGHDEVVLTGNPLVDSRYPWDEVQKIVVLNRYDSGAKPVVGLVRGFGIKSGAIAGSVAHDCHNIVAIGLDDEALVRAVNRVIEMRGGLVVVSPDEVLDLPLPIAGLMSPMSGYEIALRNILLHEKVRSIGSSMHSPFVTMSFMCLAVIPELKITDKFLLDTKMMQPILRRR